jgi:putative Holliday junction resolvase
MKYLALDIGEKRTGVAVSDELGITVRPVTTLETGNSFLEKLGEIIKSEIPETIVVGIPRHQGGGEGVKADHIREFAKVIHHEYNLPVDFEDESATSVEAERRLKEKGMSIQEIKDNIDAEAAAVILESYLRRSS